MSEGNDVYDGHAVGSSYGALDVEQFVADDEEGEVLAAEINSAKRELHALLVAEAYEKVTLPTRSGKKTLLDFTQQRENVRNRIAGGKALADNIDFARIRVDVLDELYADYERRHDAVLKSKTVKAPDPEVRPDLVVPDATGDSSG